MAKGDAAFSPVVKKAILRRTGGRCDRCGFKVSVGHFHHRKPRRMGGSADPALGMPSNGLLLHPQCHEFVESHRKVAEMMGFILGSEDDPLKVAVYLWRGWVLLGNDGTATAVPTPAWSAPVDTDLAGDVNGAAGANPVDASGDG